MQAITTESLASMLALIGAVIAISALLSGFVERSKVPQVAIFLLLGAVLGPMGMGVLEVGLDSPVLRVVATLSLALVLFMDALTLNLTEVRRNAALAGVILGPGTLIATAAIGFGAHYMLGLSPALSAILAAALASTDPVLLRGLLRQPSLPSSTRLSLRLESGLNDVVLLPVVLIAMALISQTGSGGVDTKKLLLQMLVLGPGAGVVVGLVGTGLLEVVRRRTGVRRDYESIYSLGICFAAFAAAEMMHGSGFLAAFAAGLTIAALDVELCDCFQEYGETTAEMLLMFTFVLLGSSLIWNGLAMFGATILFTLVALAARPMGLWITLAPMNLPRSSRATIAWFGPRGLSTLLLVLVPIFSKTPGAEKLFPYAANVVLCSVTLHGLSIMFFGRRDDAPATATAASKLAVETVPVVGVAPEVMTAAELRELMVRGEDVRLVDVRTQRSLLESGEVLATSLRVDPNRAKADVVALGIPKDAWAALYCT